MRTPTRMMSHIFSENIIYMSPFPSFKIPKVSGFCHINIDSPPIIDGEYLLELSLHPAPVSLWLDFRYKEKKKRNQNGSASKQKSKIGNNRTDVVSFYFTRSTVVYCATKFMIPSYQLSRKYRHLDTKFITELYTGFLVQRVPVPTLSTSCVRFDFQSSYFSQYSFYSLKNTRQFLSQAPIFKLRHLMDLNLTQLIHLVRTNNDNKKKIESNNDSNCNSNSNSSIILFLYCSSIERGFQIDGEFILILIRLSTLIDGKKQKKLSAKEDSNPIRRQEKEGTTLLLTLSVISKYQEQRDDECEEDVLKHVKQISIFINDNDNDIIYNNTSVMLFILLNRISKRKQLSLNCINLIKFYENSTDNNTSLLFLQVLLNCFKKNEKRIDILLTNHTNTDCESNSTNHATINGHERDKNNNSTTLECVLILLSKLSICIYNASINNNDGANVLVILSILLLKLSDYINHNYTYNERYSDRVLILLRELPKRNDNDNTDGNISDSESILILSSFLLSKLSIRDRSIRNNTSVLILLSKILSRNRTVRNEKNNQDRNGTVHDTSIGSINMNNDARFEILQSLSIRTISNKEEPSVMNTIDGILSQEERDDESNSNDNASLFNRQVPSKRDDDMNDNTSVLPLLLNCINKKENDNDGASVSCLPIDRRQEEEEEDEGIVIRLSTLIDRKGQKKLSLKQWEYVSNKLVNNIKDLIVNSILILLSKLLDHKNNRDENIINNKENNILILLPNLLIRTISNKEYRNDKNSINSSVLIQREHDNKNNINIGNSNDNNNDSTSVVLAMTSKLSIRKNNNDNNRLLLLLVLPTRISRTEERNVLNLTLLITNKVFDRIDRKERKIKFNTIRNKGKQNVRNINCTSTKHNGRPDIISSTPGECELIIILSIYLSIRIKGRRHEDEEDQNVISVSLIDGECVLIILLSKRIDKRCIFIRVDSVLIPLSKQAKRNDDDDDDDIYTGIPTNIVNNCNNNYIVILLSRRTNSINDTNNNDNAASVTIIDVQLLSKNKERNDESSSSYNINDDRDRTVLDNETFNTKMFSENNTSNIINDIPATALTTYFDSHVNHDIDINKKEERDGKYIIIMVSKPLNHTSIYNDNTRALFAVSKVSKHTSSDHEVNNINDSAIDCYNDNASKSIIMSSTSTAHNTNSDINNINNNYGGASKLILLLKYNKEERSDESIVLIILSTLLLHLPNRNEVSENKYNTNGNDGKNNNDASAMAVLSRCIDGNINSGTLSNHKRNNDSIDDKEVIHKEKEMSLVTLIGKHSTKEPIYSVINDANVRVFTLLSKLLILLSELSKCDNDNDIDDDNAGESSNEGETDSNCYKFVSVKDDDINDTSKIDYDEYTDNINCNVSSTDTGNSNRNNSNNNNEKCIDYNDEGMNIIKNSIRKGINNTKITLLDDNSNDTFQIRLFMGNVFAPLFCLIIAMRSSTVLTTCILSYKYDNILKALFVFNCSILYLYWIFTIDGEYQNLQRVRILVDDISLYESSWNRALRLESYLSSNKQQEAPKRGEMSQILHVM